jgi:Flp pilus assembly protein TadG
MIVEWAKIMEYHDLSLSDLRGSLCSLRENLPQIRKVRSMRRLRLLPKFDERRGVAAVEFALVLPVFLAVSLGIIEYGRALMAGNLVTNAAREGCRVAGRSGSTNAQVETAVRDFLTHSLNLSAGQVMVTVTVTAAPGNPDPQNQCANAKLRDLVTVEAKVPYSAVAFIPASFLQSVTLTSRSYMRHE